MPIGLRIRVPERLRAAMGDAPRVTVRDDASLAGRRALQWWAWSRGMGGRPVAWVSRAKTWAQTAYEEELAQAMVIMTQVAVEFVDVDVLPQKDYAAVVLEVSQLDGAWAEINQWVATRVKGPARVLESYVAPVSSRVAEANLSVVEMRTKLALLRAGKDVGFDEPELVDALTTESFYDYVIEFWHTVIPEKLALNFHIEYFANVLQRASERLFAGLDAEYDWIVVNVSPGSSKSSIFSVFWPSWLWKRMPSCRTIGGSYSHDIAMDLSRKTKDVVTSPEYQRAMPIRLREDQHAKSYFINDRGGMRKGVGVGGVAGFHAHAIVVDDPLDPNKSASLVEVNAANRWIDVGLSQRVVDVRKTIKVLVMQRLHQLDASAHLLERVGLGEKVLHVCLPAELTEKVSPPELKERYTDGVMDPQRLPKEALAKKRRLGPLVYPGQFLQDPRPGEGSMFKVDKLELVVLPPGTTLQHFMHKMHEWKMLVRYWDKAATEGAGCLTAGTLMGEDKAGKFWVLDCVAGQWDTGEREDVIYQTTVTDGTKIRQGLEEEGGSGGKDSARMTVKRLAGYRTFVDRPKGKKDERPEAFSAQVNIGNVAVVVGPWTSAFIEDMRYWPSSKFKDRVDAAAGAFRRLTNTGRRVGKLLKSGDSK